MEDSTFIGLDVHKATISVAVAQGKRGGEVRHWGTVPHRPDHVRKLVEKCRVALKSALPQSVWRNGSILARNNSGPARPYIARLRVFRRLI